MIRAGRFEKVSEQRFIKDLTGIFGSRYSIDEARVLYDNIILPKRATAGSAGYDLSTPFDIELSPGESIKIPTGIRVRLREDYCLFVIPRSGLGSKYRFQLDNTMGVIDSDYYYSENEGHIFVPMINDSRNGAVLRLKAGQAFVQCVLSPYGITEDDEVTGQRNGGFGSTG